jgi:gamma-glutamylcyclotransferase (GGCT)/AIG2-like uncharacterized protein YtfP
MSTNTNHLFVYGTLMNGQGLNEMLTEGSYIGKAQTVMPFALFAAGVPYMVRCAGLWCDEHDTAQRVKGELWRVSDFTLALLDNLEGHPVAYRRSEIAVTPIPAEMIDPPDDWPSGCYFREVTAQAYIYQHAAPRGSELIPSGDFADYKIGTHSHSRTES